MIFELSGVGCSSHGWARLVSCGDATFMAYSQMEYVYGEFMLYSMALLLGNYV